ncbi:MAG: Gfo/Idh/MocA family oxidoreductase [Planctomycetota bacterium]
MSRKENRRQFIKKSSAFAAGAAAIPYFFSTRRSLASYYADDKMKIGLIGCGGMGRGNMNSAREYLDIVAFSDADSRRMDEANQQFAGGNGDNYADYRDMLERDDIKVVHVATPDHWHTKPVVEAMLAGKDVYCEKPLTLTVDEGKLIRKVQEDTGCILQVGTQQRSTYNLFTKAMALVAEGRLGRINKVTSAIGGAPTCDSIPVADVPEGLDWDRWLGPAPMVDYRFVQNDNRRNTNCHYEFRWWYEYSGGKLTDWGAHHVDIAMWALALNGQTDGPLSIGGEAEHPVEFVDGMPQQNDRYNTSNSFNLIAKFPGDTEVHIVSNGRNGCLIEGDKGRIFVSRGDLTGAPVEALADNPLPEDAILKINKGVEMQHNERKAHWFNFLQCVRERSEPISDVHTHMEALNICHLAGIAARLGREIQWDAASQQITGDDQANSMLARPYREGYEIEMATTAAG